MKDEKVGKYSKKPTDDDDGDDVGRSVRREPLRSRNSAEGILIPEPTACRPFSRILSAGRQMAGIGEQQIADAVQNKSKIALVMFNSDLTGQAIRRRC